MKSRNTMKRLLSLAVALVMVLALTPLTQAQAAGFAGGRGTKNNPYLVATAEQFDSIRNNLSAHYKIVANIDLSGYSNWKAIGTWAKAFTGSLVCDTDANYKPLYAITGLKCTVTPNDPLYGTADYRYGDYKDDGTSGWEAGLFGVVNGAVIQNIIVLDANVVNNCRGASMQENYKGQVVNNPCYQMCAGIMAGCIINSNVINCGVTGDVSGSSNYMGGFAGGIVGNSVVSRCYAIVDVNGTGEWMTGGFVGGTSVNYEAKYQPNTDGKATISECMASGYVHGGWCGTGGFVGGMEKETVIINCYCEGHVDGDAYTYSFAGEEARTTVGTGGKYCTNVYTISGNNERTSPSSLKGNTTCFIGKEADSKGTYPVNNGFTAADKATINAFFAKLTDVWTVGDGYPQLKNVHIITALSQLGSANSGNEGNDGNDATQGTTATEPTQGTTATEPTQGNDATDPTEGNDATDPTDATDATDPTDANDPTDPVADDEDDRPVNGEDDASGDNSGSADADADSEDDIQIVKVDNSGNMSQAELVLIIVLASVIGLAVIGTAITVISMIAKKSKE